MSKLSIVISAYNEEKKIEECLKSINDLADEIVVVNSGSTDRTVAIAKKYTKHIYDRENYAMLNKNKNFGFSKATGDWILNLDPDERVTPELAKEIQLIKNNHASQVNGYFIPRKNILFKKWIQHGIWWPDYQMRLFRNGKGKFPEKHVHELIAVEGEKDHLVNPMIHENYQTISQFLYKLDRMYTDNEADNFIASGKKLHWMNVLSMPANDFLKTFFLQEGYKDGLHGLVLSLLQACYAVVIFAKVWERQGFEEYTSSHFLDEIQREIRKIAKDFQYWIFTTKIHETPNVLKQLIFKTKRKLR